MNVRNEMDKEINSEIRNSAIDAFIESFLPPYVLATKDFFQTVYYAQKKSNFYTFLEAFAWSLSNNNLHEDDIEKLLNKISDLQNLEAMATVLDSVYFSKSKKSRIVLGMITGKLLKNNVLDYEDLILIGALKDLLDEELEQFLCFCGIQPGDKTNAVSFLSDYDIKERLIMEKLQNMGILGRDLVGNRLDIQNTLRFSMTTISIRLQKYLQLIDSFHK